MGEDVQRNRWSVLLVILVAVLGFTVAGATSEIQHTGATVSGAPLGSSALATASGGSLTPVAGSSSDPSPTGSSSVANFTVTPEPQSYNASAPDSVTVTLKPSQSLETLINETDDVSSPLYRHFLTSQEIGALYGSGSYASTVSYFNSYGLSVQTSLTALTLTVSGTVAQVAAAFHTNLSAYATHYNSDGVWNPSFGIESGVAGTIETGPTFYANTAPAELPQAIASVVDGIAGLDTMVATPDVVMPLGLSPGVTVPAAPSSSSASLCSFGVAGPCPRSLDGNQSLENGSFLWTDFPRDGSTCAKDLCGDFQFLFPSTVPAMYGAHNIWNGTSTIGHSPDTGQGVTIALVEVGCAFSTDLSQFSQMIYGDPTQLPDRVTQIAINTSSGYALTGTRNTNLGACVLEGEDAGWTVETSLDLEYASTMAPNAHIDLIGIPYPGTFADFDAAYADIAQYLSLGSTNGVCPSNATLNAAGMYVVEGSPTDGACSVTITSNSYGSAEEYQYFDGSPMYITVANQELELLNAVGVTNFFASGDAGGVYDVVNDFATADSPSATSVGGAQVTADCHGSEFPVTSDSFQYSDGAGSGTAYWANATGIGGTAYWAYSENEGGTYVGIEGGGFGQSLVWSQPWWQNALDAYSSGAKIDPILAGSAAFNMTVYHEGAWSLFYGGTSFATPIEAGEWALVEEQANVALGNPEMGDVNPLLYLAHNAFEAGALTTDPYIPIGTTSGWDSAPANSFTWYFYNLSQEVPSAAVQPIWFPSLGNPAGNGWSYLVGLGITDIATLDDALFNPTGQLGHSLAQPAFSLYQVTAGSAVLFTSPTLTAGVVYTFEVFNATGSPGSYQVTAYSGQSSAGAYGGGTKTTIQTGSNGQFSYTPTTGVPPGGNAATTLGYFWISSSGGEWSFVDYAVQAPTPSGNLSLCVVDPYGNCDTGVAESTMFTTMQVGYYNLFGESQVWLNGLPVSGAVVTQVSVVSQYGLVDKYLPPADYAPGVTLGQTLSDARGEATFWPAAIGLAEVNGPLLTQVYQLTATYDGMISNTVTVYVEPQSGSFYAGDLSANPAGTSLAGSLSFAGMKYVSFVNVSVGSAPGQFVNYTCPLPSGATQPAGTSALPGCSPFRDTQFGADVWESGVDYGTVPVSLDLAGLTGPIVVSERASGANDLTVGTSVYNGYYYVNTSMASVQNPIDWQYQQVFLTGQLTASQTTGVVQGNDTFSWAGSPYIGASGTLSLVSGAGSTVLATGVSGSYTLGTTTLLDGSYSVVFTEMATGAVTSTHSVTFYADNQVASLNALVTTLNSELSADQQTITALTSTVASLQAGWSAANATIASDQATITTLNGQVSTLQSSLSSAQAQVTSLEAQVAALSHENGANATLIASLQAQLLTANSTVTADQATVASLTAEVQTLQNELNAKKNYVAPAWYDSIGSAGIALIVAAGAAIVGLAAYFGGRRVGKMSQAPVPSEGTPGPVPTVQKTNVATTVDVTPAQNPADVFREARAARGALLTLGRAADAQKLGETTEVHAAIMDN